MRSLKIVFAGTPPFALPCLDALLQSSHTVQAVYTQPDRPSGRGRKIQPSATKQWAMKHQLPVLQPTRFSDPGALETLREFAPDLMVVIAYGLILPHSVLSLPRLGCLNVHASLLPRWRGASPIQQALVHGDTETGVTIMQMDIGMDTGDTFTQAKCPIQPCDDAKSLHDKLAQLSIAPLLETLDKLATGQAKATPQDETYVTYAPKIKKEEARIQWHQPAEKIHCLIRAFNPWPIAYTYLNDTPLKIHQAQVIQDHPCSKPPGTILSLEKQGIMVATGSHALLIERIQFPAGKVISVADHLNAQPHRGLKIDSVLQ